MVDSALEFFKNILETPSPSGYEQPVQQLVREYVSPFADQVASDSHGNLIAIKSPQNPLRVICLELGKN